MYSIVFFDTETDRNDKKLYDISGCMDDGSSGFRIWVDGSAG